MNTPQKLTLSLLIATALSCGQPSHADNSAVFDGQKFMMRKQAQQDALGNDPVPRSARIWIRLQTIYDESRKCDSQKDKQLAAKIAHDQDADQIVVLANIWDLFSERIVAKRYPDAGSCLTLAAELLEDEPADSAAHKLLLQNAKQLQACESKGIAKGDALKRGYISETDASA